MCVPRPHSCSTTYWTSARHPRPSSQTSVVVVDVGDAAGAAPGDDDAGALEPDHSAGGPPGAAEVGDRLDGDYVAGCEGGELLSGQPVVDAHAVSRASRGARAVTIPHRSRRPACSSRTVGRTRSGGTVGTSRPRPHSCSATYSTSARHPRSSSHRRQADCLPGYHRPPCSTLAGRGGSKRRSSSSRTGIGLMWPDVNRGQPPARHRLPRLSRSCRPGTWCDAGSQATCRAGSSS